MTGRLAGRVGLITATGSGIGRAGALLFASEGASLVTLDVDEPAGQSTAQEIGSAGGQADFIRGDASSEADVQSLVATALERHGKIDLLWANAGMGVPKTVPDTTLGEWNRAVAVSLTSAFLLAKYGIPEMGRAGGGTMVITGSANSFVAERRWAAYCAAKGGLLMLCKAMALDHALDNVRVNILCPGSVDTPLHAAWIRDRLDGGDYDRAREEDRLAHPLGRFGTPEDVARAALFLSCEDSSFITGAALSVDGGVTAQ
jgi:NAD(P)-dependent dehydrogenase (short-subunit alcohol dehydrogenase family)